MPNFLCVALALHELGYKPIGIRLDSGDLAYLSKQTRVQFVAVAEKYNIPEFKKLSITASNDINEAVLNSLNEQVNLLSLLPVEPTVWMTSVIYIVAPRDRCLWHWHASRDLPGSASAGYGVQAGRD